MKLNEIFRLVLTSCAVIIAGCVSPGQEIQWNEEVKISTGEQIVVKRGEKRRYVGAPFEKKGWLFQEAWIEAELPNAGRLRWDTSLSPWFLDRASDGTWYLVGLTSSYSSHHEYGLYHPRNAGALFVPYRLREGNWERILGKDFPAEFKTPNLLVYGELIFEPRPNGYYWDGTTYRGRPIERKFSNGDLLDLAQKERVNFPSDFSAERYFRISQQWLDQGERYKQDCRLAGGCGIECTNRGGACEKVMLWDRDEFTQECMLKLPAPCDANCRQGVVCGTVIRIGLDERMGRSPKQYGQSK